MAFMRIDLTLTSVLCLLLLPLVQYILFTMPLFINSVSIFFWIFIICAYHPPLALCFRRKQFVLRSIAVLLSIGIWMAIEGKLLTIVIAQSTEEPFFPQKRILGQNLQSDSTQWIEIVRAMQHSLIMFSNKLLLIMWPSTRRLFPAILIAMLAFVLRSKTKKWFLSQIPNEYFMFLAHGLGESARKLGLYLRVEIMQAAMTALLWGGALWLLSVPNGWSLSVIMVMAALIPHWGIWFIGFAPLFLAAAIGGNGFQAVALIIALSAIWLLREALFSERMRRTRPRIPAIWSLALIILGVIVGNGGGVLLILPLFSILLIILQAFLHARPTIVRPGEHYSSPHLSP